MNRKWLEIQYPYNHPTSDSGGGTADQSDIDALGDDNTDDNVDNDNDDNNEDSEEQPDKNEGKSGAKKKDAKSDKSGEERSDKSDKSDETSDEESREEIDEEDDENNEDDEFGKEFDEKEADEDEEKEVESEFTVRSLKDKYPKIFKDFPEVKEAIFRDREYTKIFGSVDEAQEADTKAKYLDDMSQDLYEGKSENLLSALKKNNEESLKVFAHGFLPQLFKIDKDLYHDLTDRVIIQALQVANSSAIKDGNKNLNYAVKYLSKFIFGDFEVPNPKDVSKPKEKSAAEIELERKQTEFEQGKYREFEDSVHARTHRKIVPIVEEGLDPRGTMSDFTKEAIRDKIIEKVGLIIANDRMFQVQLASLWKRAKREGFTPEAKSRISTAYLARARKIIPKVRAQVRKNVQSNNNGNDNRSNGDTGKRQGTSGGSGKRHSSLPTDPKKIPASMSDEDILASD